MIGKYSLVKFKDDDGNYKSGYVQNIISGLLLISCHSELVERTRVEELKFEDMSSKELVETDHQLKLLHEVFRAEIKRRAYDIEKHKTRSKYFHDELIFRK